MHLRSFRVGLLFFIYVIWTSASPQAISSSCILQDHRLISASAVALLVLFWGLRLLCCLARCLFPSAHLRLRYRTSCPTKCALVSMCVCAGMCWSVVVGQQLPCSVIPVQCEESVCGFQAKQVSLCMSQLVGAIHECGWQEHTRVDVWLWVCSQSPAD